MAPAVNVREIHSTDTSASTNHLPLYEFGSIDEMVLPKGCRLVGIELTDDSIELPSFKHPDRCAYVLGPERGSLSPAMQERCDFIVKIPTKFCVNVSVAGAIVLYDRIISKGRWADRPVMSGGPKAPLKNMFTVRKSSVPNPQTSSSEIWLFSKTRPENWKIPSGFCHNPPVSESTS